MCWKIFVSCSKPVKKFWNNFGLVSMRWNKIISDGHRRRLKYFWNIFISNVTTTLQKDVCYLSASGLWLGSVCVHVCLSVSVSCVKNKMWRDIEGCTTKCGTCVTSFQQCASVTTRWWLILIFAATIVMVVICKSVLHW